MNAENQPVDYSRVGYETKGRFCSYWHQINEVRKAMPLHDGQILVIGKGSGFIDGHLRQIGYSVATLDVDAELAPSYCASVLDMPLATKSVDLVVCCQVLEHLPFEEFARALGEIHRVLRVGGRLILSLPDLGSICRLSLQLPVIGLRECVVPVPVPEFLKKPWVYNGEHYWNIGNKGYPSKRITGCIEASGFMVEKAFRVIEMSWHHFFIARA